MMKMKHKSDQCFSLSKSIKGDMSSLTQSEYKGEDLEVLVDLPNYYDWIVDTFRMWIEGHTIEIGGGIGTFSKRIVENVERLDILEPSFHLADKFPQSLINNLKVSFFFETLDQRLPKISKETYDTIVMVNVLEHIENDFSAVINLRRILKQRGHLLLFVPALEFLFSKIDAKHGHFRRYHLGSLTKMLEDVGFQILLKRYFDLAGVFPWWLINKVGKRTNFDPRMMNIYDRYFIPVTRFIEKRISPPFGKNIIIVAEKIPE